jgi:hypothetical protein
MHRGWKAPRAKVEGRFSSPSGRSIYSTRIGVDGVKCLNTGEVNGDPERKD